MFGILALAIAAAAAPDNTSNPAFVYPEFWMPKEGSGWIDFTPSQDGQIIIPVMVNGEPVRALIDTGFDQMVISKAFVDAHHLPLRPWAKVVSFGGATQSYSTPGVTLVIGAILTTRAGVFMATDFGNLAQSPIAGFDAVIGLPMLRLFEWQVDQDHHRIRFLPTGTQPTDGGVGVGVGPSNSRLVTAIEMNGHLVAPTMIDTGSDQAVELTPGTAAVVGLHPTTDMMSVGVGGLVLQPLGELRSVTAGNQSLAAIPAAVDDMRGWAGPAIRAMIGMNYLQRYNMLVDLPAGRMRLSPRVTSPRPEPKSTSGIQSLYVNGRLSIVHVMKNSPAASIGLQPGEEICALNGTRVTRELWSSSWGRAAPGTRYTLTMCDGSSKAITLRAFY